MKKLLIIFILLIPTITLAQEYISVSPTGVYHNDEEGYYDHAYYFVFSPNIAEYLDYKKCKIEFVINSKNGSLPEDHLVRVLTGIKSEFTVAEERAIYDGSVLTVISTDDLYKLMVVVMFNGPDQSITLKNFKLSYHINKY